MPLTVQPETNALTLRCGPNLRQKLFCQGRSQQRTAVVGALTAAVTEVTAATPAKRPATAAMISERVIFIV